MKRKKIAFIVQHLTNGGAEKTVCNLSFIMAKKYDIYLIVFDGKNITYDYDGELIDLELPPRKTKIGKVVNFIDRTRKVKKIKKKYNFDVVISFMFGANIINVISRKKEKVIISTRNYMSAFGTDPISVFKEKYTGKKCDYDVALSRMVAYDLEHNFKVPREKIVAIYNPCEVDKIEKKSKEKPDFLFSHNKYYFITAGRLTKQKGQWHLIKAFYKFNQKYKSSELIIMGIGELDEKLKELSKQLGIYDKVHFLGFVDNPYKYISNSSCFVFPSLFEGLGNALVETMACGTPIISYDCLAGPRELISPDSKITDTTIGFEVAKHGILVEPCDNSMDFSSELSKDDNNLYKAMIYAYEHSKDFKKCAVNAHEFVKRFNAESILKDWERLFH